MEFAKQAEDSGMSRYEAAVSAARTRLRPIDRVKAIRALDMRKERRETGLFVAEGASILVTAREAGFVPTSLVYQSGSATTPVARSLVAGALQGGADVLEVSEAVLAKLSAKENPQAMLGVFKQRWVPLPQKVAVDDCWLALEEIDHQRAFGSRPYRELRRRPQSRDRPLDGALRSRAPGASGCGAQS